MGDKYPESWYHGHKHVLQSLRSVREMDNHAGVETVREALFEMEINVRFGPGAAAEDVFTVYKVLTDVGFNEKPDANGDDPLTHRFKWTYDGY